MSFVSPPSPTEGLMPCPPSRSLAHNNGGRRSPAASDPLGASSQPPSPPSGGDPHSALFSKRGFNPAAPSTNQGLKPRTITFDPSSNPPSPRTSYDVRRPNLSRAASEATLFASDDAPRMSKMPSSSALKLADMPRRPPLSRATTGRTVVGDMELDKEGKSSDSSRASSIDAASRPPLSRGISERTLAFVEPILPRKDSRPKLVRGLSNSSNISSANLEPAFDDEDGDETDDHAPDHIELGSRLHHSNGVPDGWPTDFTHSGMRRRSSKHDAPLPVDAWAPQGLSSTDLSHIGHRPAPCFGWIQRCVDFFEPVTFHPEEFESAEKLIRSKSELTSRPSLSVDVLEHDIPSAQTSAIDSLGKSGGELPSKGSSQAQGRPILLPSLTAEVLFVMVCSSGQFLFQSLLGSITILQRELVEHTFNMSASQAPWLTGSYLLANGLSVTISGALADIYGPRKVITSSLAFLTVVNIVGAALGLHTHGTIAFLFIRAFQGLATGGLTSSSISYLGRIYRSGQRKNRIFSLMGAQAPIGYFVGAIQGGALAKRIDWWFGSNAIACFLIFALAWKYSPTETTLRQYEAISQGHTIASYMEKQQGEPERKFDYLGSTVAIAGSALVIFGLTQGSSTNWAPDTYGTLIGGIALLALFPWVESKVDQPLVPNELWKVKGFGYVILTYGLSFGSFTAYQFYACQFWLWIQGRSALIVALYFIPASTVGVIATFFVARLFHMLPGHWLMGAGCLSSAIAPGMFIANKPWTTYWALCMPAVAIGTLSPDLSFASASIFITSAVSRKYQGVAGSMLLTVQSLAGSAGTAFTETVADQIKERNYTMLSLSPDIRNVGAVGSTWMGPGHHTLHGTGTMLASLHGAWWFDLAASLLAFFCAIFLLRIPKADEQDHQE